MALGVGLAVAITKYLRAWHVFFALIYVAGAAVCAFGGFFVAWPLMNHFKLDYHYGFIPMLIGVLAWSGLCLHSFLRDTSSHYRD